MKQYDKEEDKIAMQYKLKSRLYLHKVNQEDKYNLTFFESYVYGLFFRSGYCCSKNGIWMITNKKHRIFEECKKNFSSCA
jgi:hypothetical protein